MGLRKSTGSKGNAAEMIKQRITSLGMMTVSPRRSRVKLSPRPSQDLYYDPASAEFILSARTHAKLATPDVISVA